MIRIFLEWWFEQLLACLPRRWRPFWTSDHNALIVSPVGPLASSTRQVDISLRQNGQHTPLGRFASEAIDIARPPGKPVILTLSEAEVLQKTLALPLATERGLRQTLSFEMDRETPFKSEELFWTYRIVQKDRQRGQLFVRLALLPRASVAGLLDALSRAGIRPTQAELGGEADKFWTIPLDDEAPDRSDMTGRHLRMGVAAALGAAVALALIVAPFALQGVALTDTDREIDAGRAEAARAQKLRDEINEVIAQIDLVENERRQTGRPLVTLAALTRVLPPDTYLTELRQQQRKLTLNGRSANVARVIPALSAASELLDPVFAAPVTRIEAQKLDAFTVSAEVAP